MSCRTTLQFRARGAGRINDLVFTANTFGTAGNSATLTIRNVRIDKTVVGGLDPTSVPEPSTLALLGGAVALMAAVKRRRPR